MPAFHDLRIRTKLLAALGAIALLNIALSGVMYLAVRAHQAAESEIASSLLQHSSPSRCGSAERAGVSPECGAIAGAAGELL